MEQSFTVTAVQTVYHTIIEIFLFSVGNAENVSTFICLILICCQVFYIAQTTANREEIRKLIS